MKYFLSLLLFFSCFDLTAQSEVSRINGYKFVYVNKLKYQNGGIDNWGISKRLEKSFEKTGFEILGETTDLWPEEAKTNPHLVLFCGISHTDVYSGYNYVTIRLTNINKEIVYENSGKGMGLSLKADYRIATRAAFKEIDDLNYEYDNSYALKVPKIENTEETESTLKVYYQENKSDLNLIEGIYKSYRSDSYYKIGIKRKGDNFIAILLEADNTLWRPGEVKAMLQPSAVGEIFSTSWFMGNKTKYETFASLENGGLLHIELPNSEGQGKVTSTFIKLYPQVEETTFQQGDFQTASGSGFALSKDGIVATNAHVVEDFSNFEIIFSSDNTTMSYQAEVILADNANDIALLKIVDKNFSGFEDIPYSIQTNTEIGEEVFTIGYPLNSVMGNNFKVTNGIISAITGIKDDIRHLQITVPIQPGNSGGPLFNSNGDIVGLTTAQLNSEVVGANIENVNYSIKASYLLNLYSMLPNRQELLSPDSEEPKQLKEQVKVLKNYVCLIKASN